MAYSKLANYLLGHRLWAVGKLLREIRAPRGCMLPPLSPSTSTTYSGTALLLKSPRERTLEELQKINGGWSNTDWFACRVLPDVSQSSWLSPVRQLRLSVTLTQGCSKGHTLAVQRPKNNSRFKASSSRLSEV